MRQRHLGTTGRTGRSRESAVDAALRETTEESGVRIRVTGFVGLFTDPACVVESLTGTETRQQFVECLHAWAMWGRPCPDLHETGDAAWVDPPLILHALSGADEPHLG